MDIERLNKIRAICFSNPTGAKRKRAGAAHQPVQTRSPFSRVPLADKTNNLDETFSREISFKDQKAAPRHDLKNLEREVSELYERKQRRL
jgi:hypothetical protein